MSPRSPLRELAARFLSALRPATPPAAPAEAAQAGADAARVREVLCGWLEAHRRTSWRPQVAEREGAPGASRFGGRACLAPGEPWPTCTCCRAPLTPFVQLDLASLPGGSDRHGSGLLQLFYCTADGCSAEAWEPFADGKLVRVVVPGEHPGPLAPPPTAPRSCRRARSRAGRPTTTGRHGPNTRTRGSRSTG